MIVSRKISTIDAVNRLLQGVLSGGVDLRNKLHYLNGLTLVFTTPSATVTFASSPAGAQIGISTPSVLSQIASDTTNAIVAGLTREGQLTLRAATPGTILLSKDGTANRLLGLDVTTDSTAEPYGAPGTGVPEFVAIEAVPSGEDTYVIVTSE